MNIFVVEKNEWIEKAWIENTRQRGLQNVLQNGIHYLLKAQNYYLDYDSMQGPLYYYNGFFNSNSIYQ